MLRWLYFWESVLTNSLTTHLLQHTAHSKDRSDIRNQNDGFKNSFKAAAVRLPQMQPIFNIMATISMIYVTFFHHFRYQIFWVHFSTFHLLGLTFSSRFIREHHERVRQCPILSPSVRMHSHVSILVCIAYALRSVWMWLDQNSDLTKNQTWPIINLALKAEPFDLWS